MNFPCQKTQGPAAIHCKCWALDACTYSPTRENLLPQNRATLLLGKAVLHFGRILATSILTHHITKLLGKKKKEVLLRKLF